MPSGHVHNFINLAAFAVLGSVALFAQREGLLPVSAADAVIFTAGFFVGTFLLSPDLDLAERHVNSKRAWGVLGVLWVPYGLLFSHRGWSHSWVVGPLTRLAYLAVMLVILAGLVVWLLPGAALPELPQGVNWSLGWPLLGGYYLSQWLHLIADGVRPDHKMRRKR